MPSSNARRRTKNRACFFVSRLSAPLSHQADSVLVMFSAVRRHLSTGLPLRPTLKNTDSFRCRLACRSALSWWWEIVRSTLEWPSDCRQDYRRGHGVTRVSAPRCRSSKVRPHPESHHMDLMPTVVSSRKVFLLRLFCAPRLPRLAATAPSLPPP